MSRVAHIAEAVHDGLHLHQDAALLVEDGLCAGIVPRAEVPPDAAIRPGAGVICPAFVDLQANGGGGVMLGDALPGSLRTMAEAHAALGTGWLLPTLITDTPAQTHAAVEAVATAEPGLVAGLHLEGPHLSLARKGAHDPSLIRPMTEEDLTLLCDAARRLPALLVTVAPESVTPMQIATLDRVGVIVSLGHTDAGYETCRAAFEAGAQAVTHLFNAMSPLSHRQPGLVGAALDTPGLALGLIADGVHVDPAAIRIARAAQPDGLFLVTDAMATAGSDIASFTLNGREIRRADGRLTLADGTLAGADLEMPRAIGVMTDAVGVPLEEAIAMATGRPGALLGQGVGRITTGAQVRAVRLGAGRAEPLAP